LYWMTASRRLVWHFGLEHAVGLARAFRKPLVVLEALRCDYAWASERFHRFVLDGMREHQRRLERTPVLYYPYLEPAVGAGRGLLAALAKHAVVIVGDDWPGFFHPSMTSAAAAVPARLELVDSAGLLPMRAVDRAYPTAFAFRRALQSGLAAQLEVLPHADPLRVDLPERAILPTPIVQRWPPALEEVLEPGAPLHQLPIDRTVGATGTVGGHPAARARLEAFLDERLTHYERRNDPAVAAASGLSPYLHFGHVGPHEILYELARREGWTPERLAPRGTGKRQGWWGMTPGAEAFLDQLVTWRELGLNAAAHLPAYDQYQTLPEWARRTLEAHERDPRGPQYSADNLEAAETGDSLWNAAQTQLVREGAIHNYLRMLWGKKILEWSTSPREALATMLALNDKYALDGRDPNSVSGIFWCLGRYDRPWGPERAVFGTVRYMSSANTARKFKVSAYLAKYGSGPGVADC
jgi:deoxyribodipyrimidine photo-lyase